MRVILYSGVKEKADNSPHLLWFYNKQLCEFEDSGEYCEIFCDSSTIFQVYSAIGNGCLFASENGELFCENTIAITHGDEFFVHFCPESKLSLVCDEFVSKEVHTVYRYRHFAVISCGFSQFEIYGHNLENCDCTNISGVDYFFFKFKNRLVCLFWNGENYIEVFNTPATYFNVASGVCHITFSPQISCGGVLDCKIPLLSGVAPAGSFKFTIADIPRKDNFNFHTFENYFFELLMLARLISQVRAEKLLARYLCDDLVSEISGILEFLGDFCGVVPLTQGGVILLYQTTDGRFETRVFQLEICENHNVPRVENISETDASDIENYLDADIFRDFFKFAITI